jgi:carbon storage regulator CsrA
MLVLSRKECEEIRIGDDITIRILSIKGNTVRIGFEAPKQVGIVRGELQAQSEMMPDVLQIPTQVKTQRTRRFSENRQNGESERRTPSERQSRTNPAIASDSGARPLSALLPSAR